MPIDPSLPLINIQRDQPQFGGLTGSTWLQYGSILITDVLTESYEMEQVRTTDNSQSLSIHHVIKITGIINPAVNSFSQPPGSQADSVRYARVGAWQPDRAAISDHMQNVYRIKNHLLIDRQPLDFSMGGVLVVQSPPYQEAAPTQRFTMDSNQGPKPLYCQVTQITGTRSFYVRFGIETWVDACVNDRYQLHAHRFSMAHDVDGDTWLTTRHVTGHLKFRPEVVQELAGGKIADRMIRAWAHPVPRGFKRQQVKIQAHQNGFEFAYSFVDVEQTLPLGSKSPATKLTAEFTIASSFSNGNVPATMAAVHVTAIGPKNQYRQNLLTMAVRIALRKLQKPGLISVNAIQVTYSLDNTMVDLQMKAMWQVVGDGPQGLHLPTAGLLAQEDEDDLDNALSVFREVGEARQYGQNWLSRGPKMRNHETIGTYLGILVTSGVVNGCFVQPTTMDNYHFATDSNGNVPTWAESTPASNDVAMVDADGDAVPYSFQNVDEFTLEQLSTGIHSAAYNSTGWYEDWQMDTRYYTNHQRAILPIGATQAMSPGDILTFVPPQVGTLGFPYTLKCVNWSVAWIGPDRNGIILPGPDDDSNDTLIAEDLTPAVPGIANATMKTWRISGTYWYLTDKLVTASALEKANFDYIDGGLPMGGSITDPYDQSDNIINQSKFTAGYTPAFVS